MVALVWLWAIALGTMTICWRYGNPEKLSASQPLIVRSALWVMIGALAISWFILVVVSLGSTGWLFLVGLAWLGLSFGLDKLADKTDWRQLFAPTSMAMSCAVYTLTASAAGGAVWLGAWFFRTIVRMAG